MREQKDNRSRQNLPQQPSLDASRLKINPFRPASTNKKTESPQKTTKIQDACFNTDTQVHNMRYMMPMYSELPSYPFYRPNSYVMPIRNVHYGPYRSMSPICGRYDLTQNVPSIMPFDVRLLTSSSVPVVQRYSWPFYPGGCDAYNDRGQALFGSPARPFITQTAIHTTRTTSNVRRQMLTPPPRFKLENCSPFEKFRGNDLRQTQSRPRFGHRDSQKLNKLQNKQNNDNSHSSSCRHLMQKQLKQQNFDKQQRNEIMSNSSHSQERYPKKNQEQVVVETTPEKPIGNLSSQKTLADTQERHSKQSPIKSLINHHNIGQIIDLRHPIVNANQDYYYNNYYKLNQNKLPMSNIDKIVPQEATQRHQIIQSDQNQHVSSNAIIQSEQDQLDSLQNQKHEKSQDNQMKLEKPKSSEIQNYANDFCNAKDYQCENPQATNNDDAMPTLSNPQAFLEPNTIDIAISEQHKDTQGHLSPIVDAMESNKRDLTNIQVPPINSMSNTQSVIQTKNNSTYETKNNENSSKERRFRKNNQEIIEQTLRQRPPNHLISIVENYQRARQLQSQPNVITAEKQLISLQEGAETAFHHEDEQQQQQLQLNNKPMESTAKLLVYQSSDEEECNAEIINGEINQRKRPNLNQFLEEFEEGMRTFNESFKQSKFQFLKDMRSFNQAELNKEDEIIERSIKDSNYYPETKGPNHFRAKSIENADVQPGNETEDQIQNQIPDIEVAQEASNFKQSVEILDLGHGNELKIRQCESFIPPRLAPNPLQLQSQPLSVGQIAKQSENSPVGNQQSALNQTGGFITVKQQRSQTIHNYVQHVSDIYEGFQIQPNSLQAFYPSQVQRHLNKRKNQNTDRIVHGLANPTAPLQSPSRNPLSMKKQTSTPFDPSPKSINKRLSNKHLQKMKQLSRCQANIMQVLFQKIDRRSKPIKKQDKELSDNLNRKNIYLEQDGWDILNLLKKGKTTNQNTIKDQQAQNQDNKEEKDTLNDQESPINQPKPFESGFKHPPESQDMKMIKKILKSEKDRQATIKQSAEKQRRIKLALKQQQQQHQNRVQTMTKQQNDSSSNLQVFKIVSEKDQSQILPIKNTVTELDQDHDSKFPKDDQSIHQLVNSIDQLQDKSKKASNQKQSKTISDQNVKLLPKQQKKQESQSKAKCESNQSNKGDKQSSLHHAKGQQSNKNSNDSFNSNDVIQLPKQQSQQRENQTNSNKKSNVKQRVILGKRRKVNPINQGLTLLSSDNEDEKSKKNSIKSKRLTKTQQKEQEKATDKNQEKTTSSKKEKRQNNIFKQHTSPTHPVQNDGQFDKNLNISMQATEGAMPPNYHQFPGLELHTHHHQHQHHHTYYYHFHNLEQNYQVFQQHHHQYMRACCPQCAAVQTSTSGMQGQGQTKQQQFNKCPSCLNAYNWAMQNNQYGSHPLSIHPSFSASPIMGYLQQPLLDPVTSPSPPIQQRSSLNSIEKEELIIPSREYRTYKKHLINPSPDTLGPSDPVLRLESRRTTTFLGKPSSLEQPFTAATEPAQRQQMPFKPMRDPFKPIDSPRNRHHHHNQLVSPLNKLHGYMNSMTRHDGQGSPGTGVISGAISPVNKRQAKRDRGTSSIRGGNSLEKSQVNEAENELIGMDNDMMARVNNGQAMWDQVCEPIGSRQIPNGYPNGSPMLIGEHASLPPVPPYFMMQHLSLSRPPDIGNYNMSRKLSPRFDLKKQHSYEPKSAALIDHKNHHLGSGTVQLNQTAQKLNDDKLLKSQAHSMDRKAEQKMDYQQHQASCSSSDDNEDEDGSSDDSDDENGSKSSSSSSSDDSDSSCDPIMDTKSKENYAASLSFKNNDCLNIIDSYESQQEQQQKENDYQQFFNDINQDYKNKNVNQHKKQQLQSSQQYLSHCVARDASEPLHSSSAPKLNEESFTDQVCALRDSFEPILGTSNFNNEEYSHNDADHNLDYSHGSQAAMSTPSFQMQLNKDFFQQQDSLLDIGNAPKSQEALVQTTTNNDLTLALTSPPLHKYDQIQNKIQTNQDEIDQNLPQQDLKQQKSNDVAMDVLEQTSLFNNNHINLKLQPIEEDVSMENEENSN